ncbi:helix-loop-helix protein delilah-like [Ornithodoros turicata]|uniref:helix-loop-helix protein delilah-like n=1 Tax=Ornithodoros turicata TaxID=34597 RepID=UPI0031396F69
MDARWVALCDLPPRDVIMQRSIKEKPARRQTAKVLKRRFVQRTDTTLGAPIRVAAGKQPAGGGMDSVASFLNSCSTKQGADYNLRPRRLHAGTNAGRVERRKPAARSAPLSKYRRKTANARERCRMQEINRAFEQLRAAVPTLPGAELDETGKMTKITTLRLAVNYIAALTEVLRQGDDIEALESSFDFGSMPPDLVGMILESDGESLQLSDEPLR